MQDADPPPESAADAKPDLNTASSEQLKKVPRIWSEIAKRLAASAPFSDWTSVEKVHGVGPQTLKLNSELGQIMNSFIA